MSFTSAFFLFVGNFNSNVSIIAGTVKDEGYVAGEMLIVQPALYKLFGNYLATYVYTCSKVTCTFPSLASQWDLFGPLMLLGKTNRKDVTQEDIEICNEALDFYIGGVENFNEEHLSGIIDALTDAWFMYGTHL